MDFKKNPKTKFEAIENLSEADAEKEIGALREGIDYHDHLYYVKNDPKISDAVYDKLFDRLQQLEEKFPQFQSDTSPTRRVGAEPVDNLKRVAHAAPMLSLNAVLERADAEDFDDFVRRNLKDDVEYVLEPKFDGSVADFFEQEQNRKVLDRLADVGVKVEKMPAAAKKSRLADKTLVFTGSLEDFTRDEAEETVEMLGGRATSSVSSETDYLVVGEGPGSKLEQAKKQDVEILDEKAFKKLLREY